MTLENSLQQTKPSELPVEVGGHLPLAGVDWRCLIVRMQAGLELEGVEYQYVDPAGVVFAIDRAVEVVSHNLQNMSHSSRSEKELGIRKASLGGQGWGLEADHGLQTAACPEDTLAVVGHLVQHPYFLYQGRLRGQGQKLALERRLV